MCKLDGKSKKDPLIETNKKGEKVKSYTNPKGYQAIQDHGNQPIQIPM